MYNIYNVYNIYIYNIYNGIYNIYIIYIYIYIYIYISIYYIYISVNYTTLKNHLIFQIKFTFSKNILQVVNFSKGIHSIKHSIFGKNIL